MFALAGLALDRSPLASAAANARRRISPWPSIALAALSVLSLAGYEVAVDRAAMAQLPFPAWLAGAPLVPIAETARTGGAPPWSALVAEAFAVVQTGLLVAVAVALRGAADSRALRGVFAACVLAEIVVALFARGSTSADLYAYAFDAARGVAAYHALPIDPRGPFALVGHLWSFRMLPAAYGPVWLGAAHLVAGRAADLASAILALRLLSACSLVAVLGALVALRVPPVFLGLVALDPAIPYQFVADGHNDLFGIALLLWARVAAREKPALAVVLALLAGASKISFVALAPLAFVDAGDLRRRLTLGCAAAAGAVALSLAAGGLAYPRAIAAVSAIFPASGEPGGAFVPRLTTICAVALVALALIVRRTGWPGTWAFVSLGSIPFPWYLAWGLPYAVLDPERALPYLVTFPFAAFVMTTTFPATWAWPPVAIGLPVVAALLAYGRFRGRRGAFARPCALATRRASVL